MKEIRNLVEKQFFGVASWWSNKLDLDTSRVRLFFIYLSFFTLGSYIIVYLLMAVLLESRNLFKNNQTSWKL